jgi:hypothetical protein
MARAPLFVVAKIGRLPRVLGFSGDTWVRTERVGSKQIRVRP